ncbi:hypothetical protein [Anaerovibrio sp.]|uniref:hypothetical protein n=1 Tax=Anaerovibrio sp. TaxID=1872532 RepID=UPI00388DD93C
MESANASLSYTKDGVYIKVSEASKALDELIAAGDWHIDEKELKLLALSNPYDFEYHDGIGRVSFGNYIYVINVNLKNEDELVIEIGRCYPLLDMGETDEKAFFATTLNWNELESKYKSDIPEYFDIYIPITEKNANNIDLLKKEIVSELINKGLVTSLYTEEYQKLKDTGIGFPQQFYRRLDNLEKLYELRHHCPKAIIGKRKSPEEVDVFLNYYKKVYKLIVDEKAISLAEKTNESDIGELAREEYNRLFIKEMINDGNAPMDISFFYIAGVAGIILPENYSYVHEKIEKIMREPEIKRMIKKAQSQDMSR